MADNINLKSSNSITLKLNTADDTLSIEINKAGLDTLIAALIADTTSATYKAIKEKIVVDKAANADKLDGKDSSAFANASHEHTVADITDLKYGTGNKSGTIFIKYEK